MEKFNEISNLDHVGILVKDIENHIPYYRDILNLEFLGIKIHKKQQIRTAIFNVGKSNTFLEVFEPLNESSPVYKALIKRGEGIHHICFGVNNIEDALDHVSKNGINLINKSPFIGVKGNKVAFLHPNSTGKVLTEFSENEDNPQ